MAKRTKRPKKRERGGASHPCPKCGGPTHVIITRRREEAVNRRRACLLCDHEFGTREVAVEERAQ